jgi:hypothetical protein
VEKKDISRLCKDLDSAQMMAKSQPRNAAKEVAQRLGITTTTLYTYVNGDGSPKAAGQHLLDAARAAEPHAGRPGRARHVSP